MRMSCDVIENSELSQTHRELYLYIGTVKNAVDTRYFFLHSPIVFNGFTGTLNNGE